jgi:hypothetical protein
MVEKVNPPTLWPKGLGIPSNRDFDEPFDPESLKAEGLSRVAEAEGKGLIRRS